MRLIKIGSGIFILGLAIAFLGFLLRDTRPEETAELIEALQEAPVNSVIRLSDYLHVEASEACIVFPYLNRIGSKDSKNASEINKKIEESRLITDDGIWNLILFHNGEIRAFALAMYKIGEMKEKNFKANERKFFSRVTFTKKNCTDFPSAAFVKFGSDNRIFFTFGSLSNGLRRK